MDLTLVAVPYDLGREGVGSGRGPTAVEMTGARFNLQALSLTSFAPESAAGAGTLECGLAVLATAAGVASGFPAATRR